MRAAALLIALSLSCGMPGPTPNIGLIGKWMGERGIDAYVDFSLVPGPSGMMGAGQGYVDSTVPAFSITAPEWGRMTWTFGDGSTLELAIETYPEQTCPGDPHNVWAAFTVRSINLHRTGGTFPQGWWFDQTFNRTPPVQFNCIGPTGPH